MHALVRLRDGHRRLDVLRMEGSAVLDRVVEVPVVEAVLRRPNASLPWTPRRGPPPGGGGPSRAASTAHPCVRPRRRNLRGPDAGRRRSPWCVCGWTSAAVGRVGGEKREEEDDGFAAKNMPRSASPPRPTRFSCSHTNRTSALYAAAVAADLSHTCTHMHTFVRIISLADHISCSCSSTLSSLLMLLNAASQSSPRPQSTSAARPGAAPCTSPTPRRSPPPPPAASSRCPAAAR